MYLKPKLKHLFVCARKAELRDGMLEFVYILSGREWTWQKRLGNPKISGMSLLGTVEGCSGETVRLLDIDRGRPAQLSYPWTWVPATGNLMYLMPQVGTRVSVYFKGEEETDAIAVNCIRSGDGCAEADYRDKSLTTEHGMQLRLNQADMGVVSLKEKLLLDDMEGIRIAGSGSLHILAAGEVKITASEVRVAGTGGVILYEGTAEADREGNIVVAPQGKIELSAEDGEHAIHNRGKEVTYYLAWEHEDLSHPSNRYRDAPQQKDYDWMKLGTHVAAGLMVAGGIAALAAGGVLLFGAAAATAVKIGMTVFLAGSLYVGQQALSDIRSGRVSDLDQYTRKAVAGSVVGFLTGASGLLMAEASLWGVLALGFGEGLVGSIVTQKLLNEDGEIDWGVAIAEAGFSAVTAGVAWKEGRSVRGGGGGSEALEGGLSTKSLDELANSGVKYNPDDIVAITKTTDGRLVWLENGNSSAGLEHIMQHVDQFASKGISSKEISNFIIYAIENGKVVGTQRTRTIYEVMYEGKLQRVAISIGDNGFIVGANPKSIP